jgi:hypothetical protein
MADIRNTSLEVEIFILVAMKASTGVDEYGWDTLWLLPQP